MRLTGYSDQAWIRLGRAVLAARRANGFADIHDWAEKIERSTRTLRGLERGEPVAGETLVRIADALGWSPEHAFDLLDGTSAGTYAPAAAENADSISDVLHQLGVTPGVLVSAPTGSLGELSVAEVRDIGQLIEALDRTRTDRPNQTRVVNEVLDSLVTRLGHLVELDSRNRSAARVLTGR